MDKLDQRESVTSLLSSQLIHDYRETHYQVDDPMGAFTLRIGRASSELAAIHERYSVNVSAYITAWNPFSKSSSHIENVRAGGKLQRRVVELGLRWLPGIGFNPDSGWPEEESILILGLDHQVAASLGNEFRQNAIVVSGPNAVPELVLLVN